MTSWHKPLRDCLYFEKVTDNHDTAHSAVLRSAVRTASYLRSVSCDCGATSPVDIVWFTTTTTTRHTAVAAVAFTTGPPCPHWTPTPPPCGDTAPREPAA